jgi:ribosomal-protein-alanine N-acetyltransferase
MTIDGLFRDLPPLHTARLLLRPLVLEDAPAMFAYASGPEVTRYVTWPAHRSADDSLAFLRSVIEAYDRDEVSPWGIVLRASGVLIGTCGFVDWQPAHQRAELGYALGRSYWGQGYMTEAAHAVVASGFAYLELNRIEALCEPPNVGSARVLEKVGMTYEGLLREYLCYQGRRRDLKVYSILRRDWVPPSAVAVPR